MLTAFQNSRTQTSRTPHNCIEILLGKTDNFMSETRRNLTKMCSMGYSGVLRRIMLPKVKEMHSNSVFLSSKEENHL